MLSWLIVKNENDQNKCIENIYLPLSKIRRLLLRPVDWSLENSPTIDTTYSCDRPALDQLPPKGGTIKRCGNS
jgi:hypothetical protein